MYQDWDTHSGRSNHVGRYVRDQPFLTPLNFSSTLGRLEFNIRSTLALRWSKKRLKLRPPNNASKTIDFDSSLTLVELDFEAQAGPTRRSLSLKLTSAFGSLVGEHVGEDVGEDVCGDFHGWQLTRVLSFFVYIRFQNGSGTKQRRRGPTPIAIHETWTKMRQAEKKPLPENGRDGFG